MNCSISPLGQPVIIRLTEVCSLAVCPKRIRSNRQVVSSLSKPYSNHEVKVTRYYLQG